MAYPQIMKDMLASGKTIVGLNPLLVSDSGESLIPDDGILTPKLSKKNISGAQLIFSSNSGVTWEAGTVYPPTASNIGYSTSIPAESIGIFNYTASIPVATIQDPKAVEYVLEKYIASNSHSVYQANNITGLIGVGTGSGDGTMESGYLGDCGIGDMKKTIYPILALSYAGAIFTIVDTSNKFNGYTIKAISPLSNWDASTFNACSFDADGTTIRHSNGLVYATAIASGFMVSTPINQTINLSNSGDKASKAFLTIASDSDGELYAQWMVEEIKTDGDTGDFSQLTNGTKDDFNGQTVRTVCASTPLNLLKEDK